MAAITQDLTGLHQILPHLPTVSAPVIHITGSNGKGSVSAFIDSALVSAAFKTGRFNSPPSQCVNDQIKINGAAVSLQEYRTAISTVESMCRLHGVSLSAFETLTAAAVYIFQTNAVDILILEVGMGGRYDATNFLPGSLTVAAVITKIELEHTAHLGSTLADIAFQKCGIFDKFGFAGAVISSSEQSDQVWDHIRSAAEAKQVSHYSAMSFQLSNDQSQTLGSAETESLSGFTQNYDFFDPTDDSLTPKTYCVRPSLAGKFQLKNAALAIQVLRQISLLDHPLMVNKPSISSKHIITGINSAKIPGRLDLRPIMPGSSHYILFDGAHNMPAVLELRRHLDIHFRHKQKHFICSFSAPRDSQSLLRALITPDDSISCAQFTIPIEGYSWVKPLPVATLKATAPNNSGLTLFDGPDSIQNALRDSFLKCKSNPDLMIVFTGSLYAVGEALNLLEIMNP